MNSSCLKAWNTFVGVAVITTLMACNGPDTQVSQNDAIDKAASEVVAQTEQTHASMSLNEQISFSTNDLAKRLSIEPDSVIMTGARKVNWRSGALGCPKPGMSYTEALVPGVLIILAVDKQTYGYHAKSDGIPFFCPQDQIEAPASIQNADLA